MKIYRVYIDDELYKKYKHICVEKDLSMPKQTSELIRQFVNIQEENEKRINKQRS
jgi:hypothetical protein